MEDQMFKSLSSYGILIPFHAKCRPSNEELSAFVDSLQVHLDTFAMEYKWPNNNVTIIDGMMKSCKEYKEANEILRNECEELHRMINKDDKANVIQAQAKLIRELHKDLESMGCKERKEVADYYITTEKKRKIDPEIELLRRDNAHMTELLQQAFPDTEDKKHMCNSTGCKICMGEEEEKKICKCGFANCPIIRRAKEMEEESQIARDWCKHFKIPLDKGKEEDVLNPDGSTRFPPSGSIFK